MANGNRYLATGIAVTLFVLSLAGMPAYAACVGTACNATSTVNTTFSKNLFVTGTISKGSGTFIIDHPLDPKHWILYHSFVESPDMKNVYDGVATLNAQGEATIALPNYFLALNKDYRYLATGMSDAMPNLHLASGVHRAWLVGGPVFSIAGGVPHGTISWQVTGIRKDPFANMHRVVPEVPKEGSGIVSKGQYLFPEFYQKQP